MVAAGVWAEAARQQAQRGAPQEEIRYNSTPNRKKCGTTLPRNLTKAKLIYPEPLSCAAIRRRRPAVLEYGGRCVLCDVR
eukprot:1050490-Rhodomonas_salina.3